MILTIHLVSGKTKEDFNSFFIFVNIKVEKCIYYISYIMLHFLLFNFYVDGELASNAGPNVNSFLEW
jgi:hypothetical protein